MEISIDKDELEGLMHVGDENNEEYSQAILGDVNDVLETMQTENDDTRSFASEIRGKLQDQPDPAENSDDPIATTTSAAVNAILSPVTTASSIPIASTNDSLFLVEEPASVITDTRACINKTAEISQPCRPIPSSSFYNRYSESDL
ncbi:unnamed protein product [Clavelina lepadiformis]|uniref:Uncharacterized protein n=1 Tax=Clavelina lepadiformis TaxID=159417 RepID=A0ABP0G1W3_CLALP